MRTDSNQPVQNTPAPRQRKPTVWSDVPDYDLDQGGPVLRPYQSIGEDFANLPVFKHLRNIASQHPEKLAISDGALRLTYSELLCAVEALSHRIADTVPEGGAIGILQANTAWYPVAMLASMAAGRPSVPLNPKDPDSRTNEIVDAARLGTVIGVGSIRPVNLAQEVRWIDVAGGITPKSQRRSRRPQIPSVSVDAPAIVLYTSGSTGHPKGIVNSQRSLLCRVRQYVNACHINSDDVFLPLTGPATIAGCREILTALLLGATLHLLEVESVGLRAVRARLRAEGVTITYLVPALLRALLAEGIDDAFLSLRVARIGGERVAWTDITMLRRAVSSSCLIQIGYSSTETTGSQWFLPLDWPQQGPLVPVGRLLPGIAFAIVDETGRNVGPGETGELLVKSFYVLLGQWENGAVVTAHPDPNDPDRRIFATGDLVRMDGDGILQVIGRKGRQIKINGRRVEPAELEQVLRCAPSVKDAVAIVTDDNELVAFVVPAEHADENLMQQLRELIRRVLPPAIHPTRLHSLAEIPQLLGGKVDGLTLRMLDGELRARVATPDTQSTRQVAGLLNVAVTTVWEGILNNSALASSRWDESGGDSLKLLQFVMELEVMLGRELKLDAFTVTMSFADIIDAVSLESGTRGSLVDQSDSKPILFIVPGSIGYGPSLAAFGVEMGNIARVVAVRYEDLDGLLTGRQALLRMVTAVIDQINHVQPEGDVQLIGYSLGGCVAFEAAAKLIATGRSVSFLGILDTNIRPTLHDYRETLARTVQRIRARSVTIDRMILRAIAKLSVKLGGQALLARGIDRLKWRKLARARFIMRLELEEILRMRAFVEWLGQPKTTLPIPATLFRCQRNGVSSDLGWAEFFVGLRVVPVAGGHLDMLVEPYLSRNRPLIERAFLASGK